MLADRALSRRERVAEGRVRAYFAVVRFTAADSRDL